MPKFITFWTLFEVKIEIKMMKSEIIFNKKKSLFVIKVVKNIKHTFLLDIIDTDYVVIEVIIVIFRVIKSVIKT